MFGGDSGRVGSSVRENPETAASERKTSYCVKATLQKREREKPGPHLTADLPLGLRDRQPLSV